MSGGALARNCIVFGRLLRALGLGAQPDRVMLFAESLARIGFASRADVKQAARCVFVRSPGEEARFAVAFDAFWSQRCAHLPAAPAPEDGAADGRPKTQNEADGLRPVSPAPVSAASKAQTPPSLSAEEPEGQLTHGGDRSFTYSFAEALGSKDFTRLSGGELDAARELTKHKHLELGMRASRRTAPGRGGTFDARRTLRASLRQFGEPVQLRTRQPRLKHRDVVLLCDISGSMDRYSRLLLQFIHTMRHAIGKVEAFVFGTRLTRITRSLRQRELKDALDAVAANVADWGGGTRIGECLREFNLRWARRVLARGAIVIIISDGWDRGDIVLLAREMQRLQRSAYRLIWLNPLLGAKSVRPQTIGMRAALPFIDDFLPANNLQSLVQLVLALRSLDRRRPVRRQFPTLFETA